MGSAWYVFHHAIVSSVLVDVEVSMVGGGEVGEVGDVCTGT